jgi:hypothetical protein
MIFLLRLVCLAILPFIFYLYLAPSFIYVYIIFGVYSLISTVTDYTILLNLEGKFALFDSKMRHRNTWGYVLYRYLP